MAPRTLADLLKDDPDTTETADGTLLHRPKNTLFQIDNIWAFVSVDPEDNAEGVCAYPMFGLEPTPMIAADEKRLALMIPMAQKLSEKFNMTIRLIRLHNREEIRTFTPTRTEINCCTPTGPTTAISA